MSYAPAGFDGIYRCKRHAERDAVAPIALRCCRQCLDDALARYADTPAPRIERYQDERSTDGRSIYKDHFNYYKRKDEVI